MIFISTIGIFLRLVKLETMTSSTCWFVWPLTKACPKILLSYIQFLLTNVALNNHQFLDYPSSDRQGSEASFNLVREWLAKCNSSHECRSLLPRSTSFRPTRLLYVGTADGFEDIFLTESETFLQDAKYVTLSHCWGSNPIISLQKGLVSAFKKNIPWNQLPLSFQDALVVTRKLKIKFLWIDSLCIYSHRTTMNYFESLRFVPQFFEGFNFTHLASQIWQYIRLRFQYQSLRFALPILRLDIAEYPCSKTRQFSLRRRRSTM